MKNDISEVYNNYPKHVKSEALELRDIILKVAIRDDEIDYGGEVLKWGEPTFVTKTSGSTLRLAWKADRPNSISLFVNCRTKLMAAFKQMYPIDFEYIGSREIRLPLGRGYPILKLEKCIELTFKYNLLKNLL